MRLVDMTLDTLTSAVCTVLRVTGSIIDGPHSAVLVGGKGVGGFNPDDDDDGAETFTSVDAFGAPGIVWRPRTPEKIDGLEVSSEAFSVRTGDGPIPISWRDLRWHRAFPAPKPGTIALVGYAGGFLAFDDFQRPNDEHKSQRSTWYVPYRDASGTLKAMAIACDPEGESLMLIHGDGYAVIIDKDNGIVHRSKNSKSFMQLKDGAFSVVADTISLQGNVSLGANTAAAVPLLPGVASQPTTSVFFSP